MGARSLDRQAWAERIRAETRRIGPFERAGGAVVIIFRLEGFDELVAGAGQIDDRRLCRAIVASLRRAIRGSALVSGDRRGTFRVLVCETDESAARTYVDRVAAALRPWAEAASADPRLTVAWASTSELTDLAAADRLADARLAGAQDGWIRSAFVRRA